MASLQAPGAKLKIYAVKPDGTKKRLFQGVNEQTGPGGSPQGVQATTKANELPVMPVANLQLNGGTKIIVYGELTVADGLDASDSIFNIPILRNGSLEYLSRTDLGYTTDLPAATPAGTEIQLGTGYTIPENDSVFVGGGSFFMSLEDDTA